LFRNKYVIFLINPISGTRGKQNLPQMITNVMRHYFVPYDIMDTRADGDYSFLIELIAEKGVSDIVVCGGDGSISQVAACLIDQPVSIGIVPMGSGNGLANTAGIPHDALQALQIIAKGFSSDVDSFFINSSFSCMLCGLGFDAQVAHDFARQRSRGLATYIRQTIVNFFKAKPYSFVLQVNGQELHTDAYFISIANSNQFGNRFTIAPKASLTDGLLDVVVVKKMSKLRLLWSVFKQIKYGEIAEYNDGTFHRRDVLYFQTNKLTILNPNGAPLHIDGDPANTAEKFTIRVVPRAFKLIQRMPDGYYDKQKQTPPAE
jgi:diacylglycerol kinase (ATP)